MRKAIIALLILGSINTVSGQTEAGVFTATGRAAATPFVTDYQALGINPGNLDLTPEYEGKMVTFGIAEGSASMYSSFFSKEEVRNTFLRNDFQTLDQQQRRDYAANLAGEDTRLNLDIITSGVSVRMGNAGTIAFSTRERIDASTTLGPKVAEVLFLGYSSDYFSELVLTTGDTIPNTGNLSADTLNLVEKGIVDIENALSLAQFADQTSIGFSWIREFNLGYGKKIYSTEDMEVHLGVGGKLLIGNAYMQVDIEGTNVDAFAALSPLFDVPYGDLAAENPSSLAENAPPLKPVGLGWGVDLGTTIVYKEKLLITAAVNDIGEMTWDANLYQLDNQLFTEYEEDGSETVDFIEEIVNFAGSEGIFDWQGLTKQKTKLPTTGRLGVGFTLNEKLRLAADAVMPVQESVINIDKPIISAGADFRPLPFIQLSAGMVAGNNEVAKIPVGLTFIVGKGTWEAGIASRDMITWFTESNPTASLSWGFLRFRV